MKRNFINLFSGTARFLALGVLMMFAVLRVNAQAVVTATGAGPGPTSYANLRLAFNAINAGTHTGAITITIGAAGTNEAATTAVLNQNALPASYTSVLIKPAAGTTPTITGNNSTNAVIFLYGANNVTIDGSNTAGGTTRDMTINNLTFVQATSVIRFGSPSTTVGATNNTVKNCKINQQGNLYGIAVTAGSGVTLFGIAEAPNSNNTIQNNAITGCQTAVYTYGPAALDNNWVVTGNDLNALGFAGVTFYNTSNALITNNVIDNVSITGTSAVTGITLSYTANNATISGNKISNIANAWSGVPASGGGAVAAGIFLYVAAGTMNVYNNFVANVTGYSNGTVAVNGHGIVHNGNGTANIFFNSVKMSTNQVSTFGTTAAIFIGPTTTVPCNIRDNIFEMAQTSGTRYAIYSAVASGLFATIDYNDYVPSGATSIMGYLGGNRVNLAAMIAGFGGNVNSINVTPTFVSPTDLHLTVVPANLPIVAGAPVAAPPITTDIDGANRSATIPTIGAHELLSKITYTALTNTCSNGIVTLNPVTIESATGVPTVGANIPRIYFRKGAGPWFSTAGTLVGGTATLGTWSFNIDPTVMGGVTAGDVIGYFVIAQTTGGTVFANPAAGLVAVDVNTVTTPPTTPNTYTVNAVTLVGLTTSANVCFNNVSTSNVPYAYTGTTGSPNLYMLTWSPVGPTPTPVFTPIPASPFVEVVPIALPAAPYNGTLTIKNATTGCTNVYNITLTVNPIPATITGSNIVCQGSTTTLVSPGFPGGAWTSMAPGIATVGAASGSVLGVSGGTATIVYTMPSGCSTFFDITVVPPPGPITGSSSACPNSTITLSNSVPGGIWSSFNTSIATVGSSSGIVTGVMPGVDTIYYTLTGCNAVKKTITVNPTPNAITGTLYACQGYTTTLSTTSTGGTWISGTPSIATIGSASGVVSGISGGTSIITYQFITTGCVSTNTVTIFPAAGPITGGNVVCQGLSITLGNSQPGGTWTSTLPGIVSIGLTTGVATGIAAAGSATISYILPTGCYTVMPIWVSTPPAGIVGNHVVCSGYSITLTNGVGGGTWTSGNPAIATVGASTGVVTGVVGGVVNISYSTLACNPAVYSVTVNQTPPPITGITNLCDGGSTTSLFNATPGGVWTITGGGSISPFGVVSGLSLGTGPVVTYTMPNACYTIAPITVDTLPGPIAGIDSVCPGRTQTLTTSSVGGLWSSNNSSIASVVATTGVVTGVVYGSTVISYTAISGCYRTLPFRVTNPLPASVTITRSPAMDTLCSGVPVTFTAHPVNGGTMPTFEWQLFGTAAAGATNLTYTYTPTHGDVISVYVTNGTDICSSPSPFYANIPINVYPNVVPNVTISTTSPITINYLGQVATFNAVVTSGGTHALYQWYVDGDAVPGATNNSFARAVYDNDTVFCMVNGNPPCDLGSIGVSNAIIIYGDWLQTKTVKGLLGSLSLFPNPNSGNFTLSGTTGGISTEVLSVQVVNVLGQVVFDGHTTAKNGVIKYDIDMDKNAAAGTYVLRVTGAAESQVFHFVKGE